MLFGVWTAVRPRNRALDDGPDPPCEVAIFRGNGDTIQIIGILCRELCKNGRTDRNAVWDVDSSWPKEHVLDGVQIRTHEGAIVRMKVASPGHARTCPGMSWEIGITELNVGVKILSMLMSISRGQNRYGSDAD